MTPKEIFAEVAEKFARHEDDVKEVKGVFQFIVGGEPFVMDCKQAKVYPGTVAGADTTLEISPADFENIYTSGDPKAGMKMFAMGKLKVKGNLPLSLKIQDLLGLE